MAVRILRIGQQISPPPLLRSGYGPGRIQKGAQLCIGVRGRGRGGGLVGNCPTAQIWAKQEEKKIMCKISGKSTPLPSGVARVSSARGPMLASPPPPPGGKIDKQKKEKVFSKKKKRERGALESAGPIAYATFAARLIRHCNEVTLIICLGLIFFF